MSTTGNGSRRLQIGTLSFDPGSGEVAGPAGVHRLAPQPASLLALLAERPGDVVTRGEIRDHLWPGGKVEFEQGIAFALREVRKAIEVVGGDPGVIETIPKRGFRLTSHSPSVETAPADGVSSRVPTSPAADPVTRRRLAPTLMAVAVVATIAAAAFVTWPARSASAVAVFVHGVESPGHEGLANALGFELTTALTRELEGRLGIVGPTGTSDLAGPDDTEGAREILGACLVVSGGIRAVGADSVVVFTQIVRTSDRVHVWARQDTVAVTGAPGAVVSGVVEGVEAAATGC